jgi:hypothetical protein
MTRFRPGWCLVSLFLTGFTGPFTAKLAADEPAAKKAAPGQFIRITTDDKRSPTALQTASVRYGLPKGKGDVQVDLVGVVHVGDRDYYEAINKQLQQYDVVLYELVAPKGTVIPKGGKRDSTNPLAMLQSMMKTVLALESQTEKIDYTQKNFVHADLSPSDMAEMMRKRGETGLTLALNIMADVLRQQNLFDMGNDNGEGALDFLALLFDPDAAVKLKRMMARQLVATATGDAGLGPTLNTLIVKDRNAAAVAVLHKELAKGRKKIAIFYGAAHMPDFEQRLRDELGLEPQETRWQSAWDLRLRSRGALEGLLKQLAP